MKIAVFGAGYVGLVAGTCFADSGHEVVLVDVDAKRVADLRESPPVWLPEYAVAEGQPLRIGALAALAFALLRELSGEADIDRSRDSAVVCLCPDHANHRVNLMGALPADAYVAHLQHRYSLINRCC